MKIGTVINYLMIRRIITSITVVDCMVESKGILQTLATFSTSGKFYV